MNKIIKNEIWLKQIELLAKSKEFNLIEINFGSDDDDIDEILYHKEFNQMIQRLQSNEIVFADFKEYFEENFDLNQSNFDFWYILIKTTSKFKTNEKYSSHIMFKEFINQTLKEENICNTFLDNYKKKELADLLNIR